MVISKSKHASCFKRAFRFDAIAYYCIFDPLLSSVFFENMQTLKFILQPENVSRVHDALICLSKFSESVSLEARRDKVGIPL